MTPNCRALACLMTGIVVMSCGREGNSRNKGDATATTAQTDPQLKVSTSLLATSPVLGRIGPMWVAGDRVWVGDYSGDPFLHVVDLASGKLLVSWGKLGEGPGDFKSIEAFSAGRAGVDRVIAIDGTQGRLNEIGLRSDLRPQVYRTWTLPGSPRPRSVTALGKGYVAWSEVGGSHWLLLDSTGTISSTVDATLLGADSIPSRDRLKATSGMTLCAKPNGSRFAVFFLSAGRAEIHDSMGALIGPADVPVSAPADFIRRSDGTIAWRQTQLHYLACAANSQFVLGLYSGKFTAQFKGADSQLLGETQVVDVFDWDGRHLGQLVLDKPVLSLLLLNDSATLLGASSIASSLYRVDVTNQLAQLRKSSQ